MTTLCRDCITCNVYRIMTSRRRKLPRISLAVCLRKEHSRSFNIWKHWLCGPWNSQIRIKKGQHETSEPVGTCQRLKIDPMDWRRDVPDARTLEEVVTATSDFHVVDYIMRECRCDYTYNHIVETNELRKCQVAKARRKSLQSSFNALEILVVLTTLCGEVAEITNVVEECL